MQLLRSPSYQCTTLFVIPHAWAPSQCPPRPPPSYAQVFTEAVVGIRGGLSRDFLDDKLSLNLTVNNLFGLNRYRGGSSRPGFTNAYTRQWMGETWRLAATWDIGKQVRQRRARGRIR